MVQAQGSMTTRYKGTLEHLKSEQGWHFSRLTMFIKQGGNNLQYLKNGFTEMLKDITANSKLDQRLWSNKAVGKKSPNTTQMCIWSTIVQRTSWKSGWILSEKWYSVINLLHTEKSPVKKKNAFRAGEINRWERLQKLNVYTVLTAVGEGSMGIFQCYEQCNVSVINTKEWEGFSSKSEN